LISLLSKAVNPRQFGRDTDDVPSWTAKIAEAFRSMGHAASRAFRHKIKSTPFPEKNGGVPFNASGVVQVGPRRFIFIDNHDSASFFEFDLDADNAIQRIRRRRLLGIGQEQLGDPEGLTGLDVDGETILIAGSSLCLVNGQHINDGLVRVRYTSDGDLRAEPMLGFRSWMLSHVPSLAESGGRSPDAGGLNIEGLVWDPRARALLFGLRGPASPGRVTVIKVPIDAWRAPWMTTALSAPSVLVLRIPQSKVRQGIRDISYDAQAGNFLILIGRSLSQGDEPFQLCAWDGSSDRVTLSDLTFHRSMKPEGLTTFSSGGKKQIVVVDDRGGYAVFDAHRW
jgi:hypothetical protein